MRRPPGRGDELFSRAGWVALGLVGLVVAGASLAAFGIGRDDGGDVAHTMAFATIALAELLLVFAVRSPLAPAWRMPRNRVLLGAVALSAAVVALALAVPFARSALSTAPLDAGQLAAVLGLAAVPAVAVEAAKALLRRFAPDRAARLLRAPR
jgi:Ca2+-transporting ATPase